MRLGFRSAAVLLVITALCAACVPPVLALDAVTPSATPVTAESTTITTPTPPVSTAATAEPSVESPAGLPLIAAEADRTCRVNDKGTVACWGDASAGQLDDRAIRWLADWNTYTNAKHGFSIDFPADWKVLDVPNETYVTDVEQVWFASDEFPPPQTGARPEVAITVTTENPSPAWQPQFFDDYRAETVRTNGIEAIYISGINREMGGEERVVIINLKSGGFLQIAPNGSAQSLLVFDSMVASIKE